MRLFFAALVFACAAFAQMPNEQNTPSHWKRKPDVENVRYGPHEKQTLDLYLANSGKPTPLVLYYFGGAFVVGNKYTVPLPLIDACLKAEISVASVNYRYSTDAPYPAPFADGARAVQFLRLHAKDYNLDPRKFATDGASAGADISLWIAFRRDMADAANDDPVLRQSTRLPVAAATDCQTTIDPREIRKLVGEKGARNPAFPKLYGLPRDQMDTDRAHKMYEDASAAALLSKDAPPVFLYYSHPNQPVTDETSDGDRIHHPQFGFFLQGKMRQLGVECVLHLRDEYPGNNPGVPMHQAMVAFFLKHFPQ